MSIGKSDVLQGTLDLMVLRTLESMGPWGTSEAKRRAKFYELMPAGRRQVTRESLGWERTVALMARFLRPAE